MMKELKDEVRQLRAERDGSNNEGGT